MIFFYKYVAVLFQGLLTLTGYMEDTFTSTKVVSCKWRSRDLWQCSSIILTGSARVTRTSCVQPCPMNSGHMNSIIQTCPCKDETFPSSPRRTLS